jgi:hypothetical protein
MRTYTGSYSEGMIMGVIEALISTMTTWMPEGHSVKIDGLGVFSLSLGFDTKTPSEKKLAQKEGQEDADMQKEGYRHVCIKSINFKPDPMLLEEMNKTTNFERVAKEVKVPQKNKYTLEERLAKALEIIDQKGQMTLTDYVLATGLSRSSASTELKAFSADPESGLVARGAHSHKVWVGGNRLVALSKLHLIIPKAVPFHIYACLRTAF